MDDHGGRRPHWLVPPVSAASALSTLGAAGALVAVLTLSIASVSFAPQGSEVATWWPAAGVGSALLALSGPRAWRRLLPALLAVTFLANLISGRDPLVSLLFGIANSVESLLVVLVLGAHVTRPWVRSREDIARLVRAAVVGAGTAGLLAGGAVMLLRGGDLLTAALEVAASHGASQLLVLPALLLMNDPRATHQHGSSPLVRVLLVGATLASFVVVHGEDQTLPLVFAPFLLLVVTAQVVSLRALAWTALASGFLVTGLTSIGDGPFAVPGLAPATIGALVQVDLIAIALVSLPLGVAVTQARAARRGLERDGDSLRSELARERDVVERLEEIDRVKSEFLSTVSHELRTPLTSIIGFTEVLAHGAAGPLTQEQTRVLQRIDRGAHRLVGLIENVLIVSRVEAIGTRRLKTAVDLDEVVRRAAAGAEHLLFDRSVTVRLHHLASGGTRTPDVVGDVVGNAEDLERAVLNLLTNAIKFTADGGTVDITVTARRAPSPAASTLVVEVRDTGIGISEADQPHLFERFFRAETALDGSVPGTGLGLNIVRAVAEEHGGVVELTSRVGTGTTVRIVLPCSGDDPTPPPPGPAAHPALG